MVRLLFFFILFSGGIALAQEFKVRLLTTSFKSSVYAPTPLGDSLIVCSNQKDRIAKNVIDQNNFETTHLYLVDTSSGKFSRFETFRTVLNDGPITFDKSGHYCILSQNFIKDRPLAKLNDTLNPLALYVSKKNSGHWKTPQRIWFCDQEYQYTHPALTADGKTLIFSSNRPGGYGGFDLWKSVREKDNWSEPVNMGADINTAANELFPTIYQHNLYFSSDEDKEKGLDIYQFDQQINRKERLQTPMNSPVDDFHLSFTSNKGGYFSSNRSGKDEIWVFQKEILFPDECDTLISNSFCYTLYEENAIELKTEESLIYEWDINGLKKEGESIDYCFPGPGDYEITLNIIDTILNKTYYNQSYYYLELRLEEQPYITAPDTVSIGTEFSLSAHETHLPGTTIEKYSWRINRGTILEGQEISYRFKKAGTYKLELLVEGSKDGALFTDCVYRMITATEKGISLTVDTLSEDLLSDRNKIKERNLFYEENSDSGFVVYSIEVLKSSEDLTNDNAIFTLMEKYGKVKIEYVEKDSQYSYLVGEWKNVESAYPSWRELLEDGYDEAVVRSININEISNFSIDNSFVLDNVTFDPGDWTIKEAALPDLQNIIEILTLFPEIMLRVEAHTDDRGDDEFNMELSLKRAESVKAYLNKNGISNDRIRAKGFGESQPIASNETEEGKQKNRRVEFTFIRD
ncbi:MAG: OmpA family protein [Crocinitomicaceae bacterium]